MKNRPDVKCFFHAFQKKLNCFLSHSTSISVSTTTTTTMATIINDQATYVCGCGYEKTCKGGENSRTGLALVRRLHSKVCAVAFNSTTKGKVMIEAPRYSTPYVDSQMRKDVEKILISQREKLADVEGKVKL